MASTYLLKSGSTPSKSNPNYWNGNIPWVSFKDLTGGKLEQTEDYITDLAVAHGARMADANTILVPVRGMGLAKHFPVSLTTLPSAFNQDLKAVIPNQELLSGYLYYWLKANSQRIIGLADEAAHGTKRIQTDRLLSLIIQVPDLRRQQKVLSFVTNYDDVIENNTGRILILEKKALGIFEEWFVRYRAPGCDASQFYASPIGPIPQGWKVRKLGELIISHIGGGWGKEEPDQRHNEAAWVIRGTDIPDARRSQVIGVPFRYHSGSNLRSRILQPGDIVFKASGGSKGQPVGRTLLITPEFLSAFHRDAVICASFCKRIRPDAVEYGSELLYLSFLHGYKSGEIEKYQVQSTGISNFKWSEYLEKG